MLIGYSHHELGRNSQKYSWGLTHVGPRNHVLDGVEIPREGALGGGLSSLLIILGNICCCVRSRRDHSVFNNDRNPPDWSITLFPVEIPLRCGLSVIFLTTCSFFIICLKKTVLVYEDLVIPLHCGSIQFRPFLSRLPARGFPSAVGGLWEGRTVCVISSYPRRRLSQGVRSSPTCCLSVYSTEQRNRKIKKITKN